MPDTPMPEPPPLGDEDVTALVRWLEASAAWLRDEQSAAAAHGHAAHPRAEANRCLHEDAALLLREAYDGR